jgi:uncharacterized repeat protein (TIGR01451 family)
MNHIVRTSSMLVMAIAAAALFALCATTPVGAQTTANTLPASVTSADGRLTVVMSSSNPSDAVGVDNTYTWTATNISNIDLHGVILGSHWGDYCQGCPSPQGPNLISIAPGCGGQSPAEFPEAISHFGVWCTSQAGVTLVPGASVTGSVTLRPGTGGPAFYAVYSAFNDPVTGASSLGEPRVIINYHGVVAPAATDIQITGSASNGSPPAGSTFTYTYQVKNAGPWGTYGGIIFVDTLPASLTYVSSAVVHAAVDPGTGQAVQQTSLQFCSAVGQTLMCPLFDLTNGGLFGQDTITITVAASGVPQQIVNTASIHTVLPQENLNSTNDSVTVTVATK